MDSIEIGGFSTKTVIYARYSSSSQREESIEGQIRDCTAYAERNGYMVIGTYADRAISGTTENRPEFLKMIKDSKRKQFDLVIVWKLDHFALSHFSCVAGLEQSNAIVRWTIARFRLDGIDSLISAPQGQKCHESRQRHKSPPVRLFQ